MDGDRPIEVVVPIVHEKALGPSHDSDEATTEAAELVARTIEGR
jgi:hypothetical protein